MIIAIIEVVTAILAMTFFIVNQSHTEKLGKAYDELNLTASDYNIQVDIRSRHRQEFEVMFKDELSRSDG